jgi:hypothetical protein
MYETIREHVDLFIRLFERLIEIEDSAAYQEFSAWTSSEGSAIFTYLIRCNTEKALSVEFSHSSSSSNLVSKRFFVV